MPLFILQGVNCEMELRPELLLPPLDEDLVHRLALLAERIIDLGDTGGDVSELIAEFNDQSGTLLEDGELLSIPSWTDCTTFVRQILTPKPEPRADITYEELLEVITRVCNATGDEVEQWYWLELLKAHTHDAELSNLIYWPEEYFGNEDYSSELTPKEILDIALKHRPGQGYH